MDELIKISSGKIGGETIQTVNARDIHAFLEVSKDFSTWVKAQVERARLVDGRDYTVVTVPPSGGAAGNRGVMKEYHLTTEAAKHISMMSGTDKGFEVRDYFLECEKRAKAVGPISALNDPAALRGLLLTYTEKVLQLEAENAEMAPKAEFFDAVTGSKTAVDMAVVAKTLNMGIGRNQLFQFLRDSGVLDRHNMPYQQYCDRGFFRVVESQYTKPDGMTCVSFKTVVFQKGMDYIRRKYMESK